MPEKETQAGAHAYAVPRDSSLVEWAEHDDRGSGTLRVGLEAFGPYTLYGRIGSGGMATVHLARAGDGDWLAIKRIHGHLAVHPDIKTMFLHEAQLLSRLSHPVICGILDYSVAGETPYIVMRYLHGVSLSAFITRLLELDRGIPVNLMAYIAATICDGLHYAHEASGDDGQALGLVHRDISPQNIFLTFGGSVHLLDFGVAKAAGFAKLTRTGHVKGKFAYMSPEQVAGQPVDRRSDIFALGIVLWESLTGRHLFKRKREIDTLRAIKTGAVPAPSELNPAVAQQLDTVVARSLVADRRRRFSSADELGTALWRYLTGVEEPVSADELADVLADVFPDPPTPEERARGDVRFAGWTSPGERPVAGPTRLGDLSPSLASVNELSTATEVVDRQTDGEPTGPSPAPSSPRIDDDSPAGSATEVTAAVARSVEASDGTYATIPAYGPSTDATLNQRGALNRRPELRPHPLDEPLAEDAPRYEARVQSTLTDAGDTALGTNVPTRPPPDDGFSMKTRARLRWAVVFLIACAIAVGLWSARAWSFGAG